MADEYFEILKNSQGEYWWRLKAADNRNIGWSGENFPTKQRAIDMADQVRSLSLSTPIHDETRE